MDFKKTPRRTTSKMILFEFQSTLKHFVVSSKMEDESEGRI
jgi:hypothetical protein